jgi:methionyl-tRNA synthetase
VTRDLDWGIDVPVEGAEGKNYTCGLMHLLDISRLQKNGRYEGKEWEPYWKIKTQSWFIYRKDNIVFHCIIFQRC